MASPPPYPLLFRPMFFDKVWGGRALERLGKQLPEPTASSPANVGESWELADLASTSASGAGGGAARSVIANGPLVDLTLHDAMLLWGDAMLGRAKPTPSGNFPLLIKFLDARENLSVQVHPSPAFAAANPGSHLKTESWYILDATPGAVIYKGVKPGVTKDSFEKHIRDNSVVDDMTAIAAVPGECHNLPSGTVHALGAGVLVAEVQTPSDTTFRVYDWGRTGRELHVKQALECIDFGPPPKAAVFQPGGGFHRLVTTEFFTIDEARPMPGARLPAGVSSPVRTTGADRPAQSADAATTQAIAKSLLPVPSVFMVLSGTCALETPEQDGSIASLPLRAGDTVLLPAALAASAVIHAGPAGGRGTGAAAGPPRLLRASLV